MPRISVIIPMYNSERTIAAALASVQDQTWPAAELLVVDNGSTDGSVALVKRQAPAASLLHEPRRGAAAARNRGIAEARGDYMAFLDADDRMAVGRLELQSRHLLDNPAIDMVFGQQYRFQDGELPWEETQAAPGPERVSAGTLVGAMLCRRSLLDRVGPFDEELAAGEFLEWYARAKDHGAGVANLDQVAIYRRAHSGNLTRHRGFACEQYARAIKQILDRRRGA